MDGQGIISFLRDLEREGGVIRDIRIKNAAKALIVGGLAYLAFESVSAAALFFALSYFVLHAVLETYRGIILWVYRRDVAKFEGDSDALSEMLKDHEKKAPR